MILKARAWYVRLAIAILKRIPDGVVPFRLEAARVGQDTTTWLRVITNGTPHTVSMLVPDSTANTTSMESLRLLSVEVWVEYMPDYKPGGMRAWSMVGKRNVLVDAVAKVYDFAPTSKMASPSGIHPT